MAAVAVMMIGFFALIMTRVTDPRLVPLFSDLNVEDSSAIIQELEAQAVPYELRNEGAIILVPKDTVLKLRMAMAQNGLPSGGSVGYEIFDRGDTLGATSFVQNINRLRALEGELSRTIQAMQRVVKARVHLVLPERKLFQKNQQDPTASIALKVRGELTKNQVQAIRHLVASGVPGLKPSRISIVDENGRLLASGEDDEMGGVMLSALEERKQFEEKRLQKSIEDIVFQIVGDGRARIQVTAELERNRVTQTSDIFDPNGQVIRSTQSRSETTNSNERLPDGGVTAGNELPGADGAGGDAQASTAKETTDETINYEISRTTTTEVTEAGKISRLSVAVVVDGVYTENAAGELTYAPRDDQQLQQIATLVRSAIGFQETRGDVVEVVNMRFVANPAADIAPVEAAGMFDFAALDLMYIAELAVILLVSLILVLFIMRPLVRRILSPDQQLVEAVEAAEAAVAAAEAAADGGPKNDLLDAAQADGAAKADMIRQVSEMVEANPDEAAAILRNWMQEAA